MTKTGDGSSSTSSNGSNSSRSSKSDKKSRSSSQSTKAAGESDRDNTVHPTVKSSSSSSTETNGNSAKRPKVERPPSRKPQKSQKTGVTTSKEKSDGTPPSSTSSEGAGPPPPAALANDGYSQRLKRLELNRKAAKLSRQRRKERIHELEETAAKLRKENQELKIVNATLRNLVETSRNASVDRKKMEELQMMNAELKRTLAEYQKASSGYEMESNNPPMLPRHMGINHMSKDGGSTPPIAGSPPVYGYPRVGYHPMAHHSHQGPLPLPHQHYNNHGMYTSSGGSGSSVMYGSSIGPSSMAYCETISEPSPRGHEMAVPNGMSHRGERQW